MTNIGECSLFMLLIEHTRGYGAIRYMVSAQIFLCGANSVVEVLDTQVKNITYNRDTVSSVEAASPLV